MEQIIFDLEERETKCIYGGGEYIIHVMDGEGNITTMIIHI